MSSSISHRRGGGLTLLLLLSLMTMVATFAVAGNEGRRMLGGRWSTPGSPMPNGYHQTGCPNPNCTPPSRW
uniref:Uncharacterized protein n=1 Tax=Oryza brachyantha TaxID=4533 RepID=J3N0H5_ORYBR